MQELMKFEGNNVNVIWDENGNPLFEVYSTGMALGHVKKNAVGVCYPRKDRIDENLKKAEITPCVRCGHKYINESQLYDFMLEARTDKCREFRKWVTNEVLPSIRKTGNYSVSSNSQQLQPEYVYINKTFRARPVLTANDIVNLYGINSVTLYNFIKTKLLLGRDYDLLQGEELKEYTKENPSLPRCRKSVFVIYNIGLSRIISYYELDNSKTPSFIVTQRGYVVQADVRQVMEFVRREIKGVEALTYLVESDDSPANLERYRKILVQKLSNICWWKSDVNTIKLGIHNITGTEIDNIHNAVYGMKY